MASAAMSVSAPDSGRLADRLAIERLNADLGHELDRGTPEGFAALFTEEGLYAFGSRVAKGRAQILQFAQDRLDAGPRTSRHVASSLRIDFVGADRAHGISVCATFSAPGEAPIASTQVAVVGDFVDVYARVEGRWLVAERHITPLFQAS